MWNYRPCRLINCFYTEKDSVTVLTFEGPAKLTGGGMIFWMNADGKHTVADIVDLLKARYTGSDPLDLYKGVLRLIKKLQQKGVLISNWDPIYKDELPQEVNLI
jgi:FMN phosphatase YigB (HAD superfamily)